MQIQDHKKNGMQHALPKFSTIFSSDFYVARILLLSFLLLTLQEIQRHTLIFSVFNKQASHGIQPLDLPTGYSFQMGSPNCMDLPTVSLQEYREVNLKVLFATENTAPQPFNGQHHTYNNQINCIQSNSTTQKAILVPNPNKNEKKIFVSSSNNVWDVPDVTELRPQAVPRLLWHTVLELYRYKHKKPCTPPHKILVK